MCLKNNYTERKKSDYKEFTWTFQVVQWMKIHSPKQGTQVQSLVREDFTCWGATEPMSDSYGARALEPMLWNERSHRNKKPAHRNWRVAPARHN